MTRAARSGLLDVNLLVALFDPDHVHHDTAHDWFAVSRGHGWATFDRTIPLAAVAGGVADDLVIISE